MSSKYNLIEHTRETLARLGPFDEEQRESFAETTEFREIYRYLRPFSRTQAEALFGAEYYWVMSMGKQLNL